MNTLWICRRSVRSGFATLALAAIGFTCLSSPVVADDADGDAFRSSAIAQYKKDRQAATKFDARTDWFPNATELEAATADTTNFEAVKGVRGVIDGRQLALGSEGSKVHPGDIVRIVYHTKAGKSRRLLMVYMGEQSFPGSNSSRSFFIYPLNGKLEYNTFPPRKDERYLQRLLTKASGELLASMKLSLAYSFEHDPARNTDWLKGRTIGKTPLYIKVPLDDARYQVFRARSYPTSREDIPPFSTLWTKYRANRPEIKSHAAKAGIDNVCAIELSFTLDRHPPAKDHAIDIMGGKYFLRSQELSDFLRSPKQLGPPDVVFSAIPSGTAAEERAKLYTKLMDEYWEEVKQRQTDPNAPLKPAPHKAVDQFIQWSKAHRDKTGIVHFSHVGGYQANVGHIDLWDCGQGESGDSASTYAPIGQYPYVFPDGTDNTKRGAALEIEFWILK